MGPGIARAGPRGNDHDDVALTLDVTASVSLHVPSVMHLVGMTPGGSPDGGSLRAVTRAQGLPDVTAEAAAEAGADFLLPLSTLLPATGYEVTVELLDADGRALATDVLHLTAPVPPGPLTAVRAVDVAQPIGPRFVALSLIGNDSGSSYLVVVDNAGRLVWWRPAADGQIVITPVLGDDGVSFGFGEYAGSKLEDTGTWYRVRFDGTATTTRRLELGHHSMVQLPGGDLAWLAFDFRDVTLASGTDQRMATDRIFHRRGCRAGGAVQYLRRPPGPAHRHL